MNEGINIIVVLSHKIDDWHSRLHSRFVHGTKWHNIADAINNIVESVDISGPYSVRYFPIHDSRYALALSHIWEEGLTVEELQEYLDE